MKLYLLIDGYNLMHAAGLARQRYGPGDLERCRKHLQNLLKTLLDDQALRRSTVVYDAFASTSNRRRQQADGLIKIIFAPQGTDADSVIEHLLDSTSVPRQTLVVSSDHRLHKAARRRKAQAIDSEDFLSNLQNEDASPRVSPPPVDKKPTSTSQAEIEKLAQEFSDHEIEPSVSQDFSADYLDQLQREIDDLT